MVWIYPLVPVTIPIPAMAAINIYVAWSTPSDRPGDTCLSNDLAQCHPVRSPFVPGGGCDALDVSATWQVVVDVVSKTMPLGTAWGS